jgi:hypothetical protein
MAVTTRNWQQVQTAKVTGKLHAKHLSLTLGLTAVFAAAFMVSLTVQLTSLHSVDSPCRLHRPRPPLGPPASTETAAVCAIVRDEQLYLEEWVLYHLGLGFHHIYLYDNSQLQTAASWRDQLASVSAPEIRDGTTVVPFLDDSDTRQFAAYRDCMQRFGSEHT